MLLYENEETDTEAIDNMDDEEDSDDQEASLPLSSQVLGLTQRILQRYNMQENPLHLQPRKR